MQFVKNYPKWKLNIDTEPESRNINKINVQEAEPYLKQYLLKKSGVFLKGESEYFFEILSCGECSLWESFLIFYLLLFNRAAL